MEVTGKNGMQVVKDNTDIPFALPWNGEIGIFVIRMLNAVQLRACGNFSTLELDDDDATEVPTLDNLLHLRKMQERMMRASMISPTYDEIFEWLSGADIYKMVTDTIEAKKKEIRTTLDIAQVHADNEEIRELEIMKCNLFPDDFVGSLTVILLEKDTTDIRKVTRDMLFEWAVSAEKGNDNPADHASGVFSDFQREDINRYAQIELIDYREREKAMKGDSKNWVRGRKKKR